MKGFVTGLLFGLGIGLLVAPMRGEETRRQLADRFAEMRGYLPENEQFNEYVSQVSGHVSQAGSNLKGYAQQAVSTVKDTGSTLGELGQKAGTDVKQAGQGVVDTTKQTVKSARQSAQTDQNVVDTTKQTVKSVKQSAQTDKIDAASSNNN